MGLYVKLTVVSLASVLAAIGAYLYRKKRTAILPSTWEEVGKLTKLNLYPLKSGRRIELNAAECTEFGLRQLQSNAEFVNQLRDRCLVVYGEKDREFRTARTYPNMVLIDVAVHDSEYLAVDAPTMRTLYVKVPSRTESKETLIRLHKGEQIHAIDCGEEAALWFSRYILGKDQGLRLGFHDASRRRDISKVHKTLVDYYANLSNSSAGLYSDLTAIMLINQASVDDLNKRIGSSKVTVDNFRPNFVIEGANLAPYVEEEWDWLKIGDVLLRNVKECTRCIMTTIDPEKATRSSDREPLKTLEKYHVSNGPQKIPVMGINCEVMQGGVIKLGDPVYVPKERPNQQPNGNAEH